MLDNTNTWELWQLEIIDNYLLGYIEIENQIELSKLLNKNINSVKIKLSRRRKELENLNIEKRKLSTEEYLLILSNRFNQTSEEIASTLDIPLNILVQELDEYDNLECKEYLMESFEDREMSNDEYELFIKLYKVKKKNKNYIAHILNRNIEFVDKVASEYDAI